MKVTFRFPEETKLLFIKVIKVVKVFLFVTFLRRHESIIRLNNGAIIVLIIVLVDRGWTDLWAKI